MVNSTDTAARDRRRLHSVATGLVVVALVLLALVGTTGVVVAEEHQPGRACPGDNPSQGLERATANGNPQSLWTFQHVVCPRLGCDCDFG